MANKLPPLPLKVPLVGRDGIVSTVWVAWLRELVNRVGGIEALSITEIETELEDLDARVTELE